MKSPSTYWSPCIINICISTINIPIVTVLQETASVIIKTSEGQTTHFIVGQCLCEEKVDLTACEETKMVAILGQEYSNNIIMSVTEQF